MGYPAFLAFAADREVTFSRWRVYMALQPPVLSHAVGREIKLDVVHRLAHVSRGSASSALGWLILRGYLTLHGRDARGMPTLSLAYALPGASVPDMNRSA